MSDATSPAGIAPRSPGAALPASAWARGERALLLALFAVSFALRVADVRAMRVDSDETQHLHVAWAWTQGRLPYRDVFDNHAPLFHLVTAPLVLAMGERADAILVARLAMFPLFAATLLLAASIGRRLFDARTGAWTAALLALGAKFFVTSLQFRTDDLWIVLWLAAVRVLVGGPWTARRAFGGGLVLGLAFATSLKTSLLVSTWIAAAAVAAWACPSARAAWAPRRLGKPAIAAIAGAAVVPALCVGGFAAAGALDDLIYCTVRHNLVDVPARREAWQPWALAGLLVGLLFAARRYARRRPSPATAARLGVFLQAGLMASLLCTVWPTNTPQDWLPLIAAGALLLASEALPAADRLAAARARRRGDASAAPRTRLAILALLALAFLARTVALVPPWQAKAYAQVSDLAEVLRITDPGDTVMDAKGAAVFRDRPVYWVLETLTKQHVKRGEIDVRIPARLVETRTAVLLDSFKRYLDPEGFMASNYIGPGNVRVAGHVLPPEAPGEPAEFNVAIPGRYAVVGPAGAAVGSLDGTPYSGPRALAAGTHRFVAASAGPPLAFVWAKAVERGFDPFARARPGP